MTRRTRPRHDGDTRGMAFAFWAWAVLVGSGLAAMIALPLTGR